MTEETRCTACNKTMPVVDTGKLGVCPSCKHPVTNTLESQGTSEAKSPASDSPAAPDNESEQGELANALQERLATAVDLLPPQFLADDPDFVDYRVNRTSASKVLLPDASGGVQSVDGNIVRIQHKGKTIDLVALTPEQRRKRQRIINIVSIFVGCFFLALFFLWLNQ